MKFIALLCLRLNYTCHELNRHRFLDSLCVLGTDLDMRMYCLPEVFLNETT